MQDNSKKKLGATTAAIVIIILVAMLIAGIILLMTGMEDAAANGILGVYAAVLGAVIIGVIVSLVRRLREIKGGEEEEAKKY